MRSHRGLARELFLSIIAPTASTLATLLGALLALLSALLLAPYSIVRALLLLVNAILGALLLALDTIMLALDAIMLALDTIVLALCPLVRTVGVTMYAVPAPHSLLGSAFASELIYSVNSVLTSGRPTCALPVTPRPHSTTIAFWTNPSKAVAPRVVPSPSYPSLSIPKPR